MTLSQKIDLENRIFALAAWSGARVDGVCGVLRTDDKEIRLQLLVCVYNAFFGAENRAFCAEDSAAQTDELDAFRAFFWAEAKRLGPLGPSGGILRRK